MKRKRFFVMIGCVLIAVLLTGYIWWYMPTTFLKGVDPAEVARIGPKTIGVYVPPIRKYIVQ